MRKKSRQNAFMYIDGENIPEKKYEDIDTLISKRDKVINAKVYGLQNDNSTKAWSKRAQKNDKLKDIRLFGQPEKNKVDRKIIRDIRRDIRNHKKIDRIIIVSSDKDFAAPIREIKEEGIKVTVIGESKSSSELRKSCDEFKEI